LLLGAGDSGKSTIFKQFLVIYGKGFSQSDKENARSVVIENALTGMKTLIKASRELRESIPEAAFDSALESSADAISCAPADSDLTPALAEHLAQLWKDPGIRLCFKKRGRFHLQETCSYFFDKIHALAKPDYLPSEMDLFHTRVRTTGIMETKFEKFGIEFQIFDVGGQRNERKKWIHCFEGVDAVLFVASLAEYDEALFEDDTASRSQEALTIFDEICNSKWFCSSEIILMLTKQDLLTEKIKTSPINAFHPEFTGGDNVEEAIDFFRDRFLALNKSDKSIAVHNLCATNRESVGFVSQAMLRMLVQKSDASKALL